MATTELLHNVRAMTPQEQAISMAVAVLMDRLQRLSDDDRRDLMDLFKELAAATNDEDRTEIGRTMLEIFEAPAATIEAFDLATESRPDALQKWTLYVAKKVREARESVPMTQEQLSAKSGLPQSHISRIENARLSPSRVTLEKIATALKKSLHDFDFNCSDDGSPGDRRPGV